MLTLWLVGDDNDILKSVIDALFLTTQNYHKRRPVKNIAEVNATGVVYTPGVCCEG